MQFKSVVEQTAVFAFGTQEARVACDFDATRLRLLSISEWCPTSGRVPDNHVRQQPEGSLSTAIENHLRGVICPQIDASPYLRSFSVNLPRHQNKRAGGGRHSKGSIPTYAWRD